MGLVDQNPALQSVRSGKSISSAAEHTQNVVTISSCVCVCGRDNDLGSGGDRERDRDDGVFNQERQIKKRKLTLALALCIITNSMCLLINYGTYVRDPMRDSKA